MRLNKIYLFVGLIAIIVFFFLSLPGRIKRIDDPLGYHHHTWAFSEQLLFTQIWLKEGPVKSRFLCLLEPDSIEYDNISERACYALPPGTIIPTYIVGKIIGKYDTESLIFQARCFNLFSQLLVSILLFYVALFFVVHTRNVNVLTIIFSLTPPIIYLYSPINYYFYQNILVRESFIAIPILIIILFELRYLWRGYLSVIQKVFYCLTVFYGAITSWFFYYFVFFVFIIRCILFFKKVKYKSYWPEIFSLIAPIILALTAFVYQLLYLNKLTHLLGRYEYRSRQVPLGDLIDTYYFSYCCKVGFGESAFLPMLFVALICLGVIVAHRLFKVSLSCKKVIYSFAFLIFVTIAPCILYTFNFQNAAMIHDIDAIKWGVPVSLIPFSIFNIILLAVVRNIKYKKCVCVCVGIAYLACMINWWQFSYAHQNDLFGVKDSFAVDKDICLMVSRNTSYNDICFSYDFSVPVPPPPNFMAYAGKKVTMINNVSQAMEVLDKQSKKKPVGKIFLRRSLVGYKEKELLQNSWSFLKNDNGYDIYKHDSCDVN